MKCEKCGRDHDGSFGSGKFCSVACANSRGARNEEFKKKVSDKLKIERPIIICEGCGLAFTKKRKTSRFCSRECARKNNIKIAKKVQIENPPDWSKIHIHAYKKGNNYVAGGTTKWYKYKDISVQGTYELRMCFILDKMIENGEISGWEYTKDRFDYISINGTQRNYLLDFKVFDSKGFYYIEVKGYVEDNDFLKWRSVRELGHTLKVFYLDEIILEEKRLGII